MCIFCKILDNLMILAVSSVSSSRAVNRVVDWILSVYHTFHYSHARYCETRK